MTVARRVPRLPGRGRHGAARCLALALAVATLVVAAPSAGAATTPVAAGGAVVSPTPTPTVTPLSNERTVTRWAHTNLLGAVRAAPDGHSRTVAQLHWDTGDALPEVYLVLARTVDAHGQAWLRIRVPGRPNGRTGWVHADQLSSLHTVQTQLTVNLGARHATLRRDGRVVWSSPVGVGKPGTVTPSGHFYVRERLRNLDGSPMYGPWAFATSASSKTLTDWPGGGVIGIHGTDQPELIPGRPSHGCVRVPNAAIERLARLMPIGTPVLIR